MLTSEEARLAEYCVSLADMGFGLTREGIAMAYAIVEKTGCNHSFKSGHAGRGWYDHYLLFVPLRLCHMLIRKESMIFWPNLVQYLVN